MELKRLEKLSANCWQIPRHELMLVPGILYGSERLLREMDDKVYEQLRNVAALPGIVEAAYAMPDAHWGYGFPIGGVAAFDPTEGGIVSAGGVGFDISCGVRMLRTGLQASEIRKHAVKLAEILFQEIPSGVGSHGGIELTLKELNAMLEGGARWAVERGFGKEEDLNFVEEQGQMKGADSDAVSDRAKQRQKNEMGTLGSGNHYLEVQEVREIYNTRVADAFGLKIGDAVVSIHCGSRGLGHQIGTEALQTMSFEGARTGIQIGDRELACAPIESPSGRHYLKAMRAGINCALANRQILTHLTHQAFIRLFPETRISVLYDVSHNTCKEETHEVNGQPRRLFVHRKGATRAFGPGHKEVPDIYRTFGQPVIIGGTMGTASFVLVGTETGEKLSWSSSCHGAGRAMSRHQALHLWQGREVVNELKERNIIIRSGSLRGVAEEAPGAYKDVNAVIETAHEAGLSQKVARVEPLVCIKG